MRLSPTKAASSPTKQHIFADTPPVLKFPQPSSAPSTRPPTANANTPTLREVDVNVANASLVGSSSADEAPDGLEDKVSLSGIPPLKRQMTHPIPSQVFGGESKLPMKRRTVAGVASEGRENVGTGGGRRLRPRSGD
jgi:hypothetical protein